MLVNINTKLKEACRAGTDKQHNLFDVTGKRYFYVLEKKTLKNNSKAHKC